MRLQGREALLAEVADRRRRTLARIDRLTRDQQALFDATADAPDDEHDPEGATIGFERAQVTALLAEARAQVDALDRVRAVLEGPDEVRCGRCGTPIELDRLLARPTARTCIDCARHDDGP